MDNPAALLAGAVLSLAAALYVTDRTPRLLLAIAAVVLAAAALIVSL